ncbi:MAG TPA: glycosyltransferase [Steroidobacteraceae bacterium]|nr:glycosyltransferase [Steroidobacteraceae bacterium]
MTTAYEISIVIPSFAEDATLVALLKRIRGWQRKPREVIVADGSQSIDTRRLCARYDALWVPSVHGRGVQLAKGAAQAHGSVLWFLYPDAEPHPESLTAIAIAIDSGASGGYFRWRSNGMRHWPTALLELGIQLRSHWGVPHGEQGLFVEREAFEVCGGFEAVPLFEQVRLVKALRRQGRFDALQLPIGVSELRWRRRGWWRQALGNRLLALGYIAGLSPARLARWSGQSDVEAGS